MNYDVIAVDITTNKVRILERDKTKENAEAIVKMAVIRRGVEQEFYAEVPSGVYSDGANYRISLKEANERAKTTNGR